MAALPNEAEMISLLAINYRNSPRDPMFGFTFAKNFLINDKAPYIVTLFVAALSWTAIRTSDRLASVPFVEYRVEPQSGAGGVSGIELRIRNITQASRFDCFTITLVARRSESLILGDAAGQQHQLRGTVFASLTVKLAKPNEWEIEATNISPGADIALFVPATGIGKPAVLASSCAGVLTVEAGAKEDEEKKVKSKVSAGVLPVLVEQSRLTWFVEHEIAILWSAL
jgi:hypothetical protein